jgi:hypothetical protein
VHAPRTVAVLSQLSAPRKGAEQISKLKMSCPERPREGASAVGLAARPRGSGAGLPAWLPTDSTWRRDGCCMSESLPVCRESTWKTLGRLFLSTQSHVAPVPWFWRRGSRYRSFGLMEADLLPYPSHAERCALRLFHAFAQYGVVAAVAVVAIKMLLCVCVCVCVS